jgi:RimJ/RimL family protein N-acetyltransferase
MRSLSNLIEKNGILFNQNNYLIELVLLDDSDENALLITKWRKNNLRWYDSYFPPTISKTRKWIKKMINNSDDNVFFIIKVDGRKIGHIGLCDYDVNKKTISIMSVVKGESIIFPRLMEIVSQRMIGYSFDKLDINRIKIRVFSDNFKAINLYERCGLLTVKSIPMKRFHNEDGWIWKEVSSDQNDYAERYINIMEIYKNLDQ